MNRDPTARDALAIKLLGDLMKQAGRDVMAGIAGADIRFGESLAGARAALDTMTWSEAVTHALSFDPPSKRPFVYPEMNWTWEIIELEQCLFWPGYGEKEWARGSVPEVALKVRAPGRDQHQARIMANGWSQLRLLEMPVIAVRLDGCRCPFGLDDGNHRAVAAFLNGERRVQGVVGSGHRYYQEQFQCYNTST